MRSVKSALRSSLAACAVVGALGLTASAPAMAQGKPGAAAKPLTDKQKKDLVKKVFKDAEAKYAANDFAKALELYKQADELVPGGKPKFQIAACLDKLNKPTDAVAAYQAFLDSKPDAEKLKVQIGDAKTRIDTLKKTPGKLRVVIDPPEAAQGAIKVTIDGAPAQAASEKGTFTAAPGKHKLVVTAEGYDPAEAEFDQPFADTREVSIKLAKGAPAAVAVVPPPVDSKPAPTDAPPPPAPRSKVPAYVTLGLAGAGAIVGTIFGVTALGDKSNFDKKPTNENADKADRDALIADMSFAVALTFGVTGAVLLFTRDSTPEAKPAETKAALVKKPSTPRGFIAPYATPTGGGAAAKFTF